MLKVMLRRKYDSERDEYSSLQRKVKEFANEIKSLKSKLMQSGDEVKRLEIKIEALKILIKSVREAATNNQDQAAYILRMLDQDYVDGD